MADGILDFYQIHTYNTCQCSGGPWEVSSPLVNKPENYNIHKPIDTVFYRTYSILYHKFGNMVIFRSENLYWLCSSENQHQKMIYYLIILSKKVEIGDQIPIIKNI